MTDKEKIREKIEKDFVYYDRASIGYNSPDLVAKRSLCHDWLKYIDSLSEEPVSEDLEEAARESAVRIKGFPGLIDDTDKKVIKAFKAGADWQKKRLPKWKKTEDPDGLYWSIDEATIVFKGYALDLTELEDVLEKED